jgi:TolB protein
VRACIDGVQVASTEVDHRSNFLFLIDQPIGESFEGKEVTFMIGDATARETAIWEAGGGAEINLTATGTPGLTATAPLPPDGSKIVFTSKRDGNYEIYVMNADGSGQTRVTDDPAGDHYPTWSPDGTKIAFASKRDGDFDIYVMNPDGSGQTRLFDGRAASENN